MCAAFRGTALLALAACSPARGPAPTLSLKAPTEKVDIVDAFTANLRVTTEIEEYAIRKPPIHDSVQAQIDAMTEYVRRHGHGAVDAKDVGYELPESEGSVTEREGMRLAITAVRLFPYLGLDSGPTELSEVAFEALKQKLGQDAAFRPITADDRATTVDMSPEIRDGIGFIWFRHLDQQVGERLIAVLGQWKGAERPLRAIVLDVGAAEFGDASTVGVVVNAFAPGKPAVEMAMRSDKGDIERRRYQGRAELAIGGYATMPIFLVTSPRTGSMAESLVYALQQHRRARVLGGMTAGTGRVMAWSAVPTKGLFGFTAADLYGSDGASLSGKPIVPDVCMTPKGPAPVPERTPDAYRSLCDADGEMSKENVIEYVRSSLSSEPAGEGGAVSPLKRWEHPG